MRGVARRPALGPSGPLSRPPAAVSPGASGVLALQRAVGNRAVGRILQRRVVRLDGTTELKAAATGRLKNVKQSDAEVSDKYATYLAARHARAAQFPAAPNESPEVKQERKAKRDDYNAEYWDQSVADVKAGDPLWRVWSAEEPAFLKGLGVEEKLYIVAHGTAVRATDRDLERAQPEIAVLFGRYQPGELAAVLVENGLPKGYRGRIFLEGCNAAAGEGESYATKFQAALAKHGRYPPVKAALGAAYVDLTGQVKAGWLSHQGDDEIQRIVKDVLHLPERYEGKPVDGDLLGAIRALHAAVSKLRDLTQLAVILDRAAAQLVEQPARATKSFWLYELRDELERLPIKIHDWKRHDAVLKPILPPLAPGIEQAPQQEKCVIC